MKNFDRRLERLEPRPVSPAQLQAQQHLRNRLPDLKVAFDPLVGSPKWLRSSGGFLSGPAGVDRGIAPQTLRRFAAEDPHRAVKAFLDEHQALFGHSSQALETAPVQREFITPHSGLRTVVWQQYKEGIPVFQGILIAHLAKRGELVSLSSRFLPELNPPPEAGQPAERPTPRLTAVQAIVEAARSIEWLLDPGQIEAQEAPDPAPDQRQLFHAADLPGNTQAQLVWLPMDRHSLRLCWEIFLTHPLHAETFRVVVDGTTGEPLVRHGLTQHLAEATYRVFAGDSPTPSSPGLATPLTNQPPAVSRLSVVTAALDTNASPNGWIPEGTLETVGNNVQAHLDRNGDNNPDLPRPQATTNRVFNFPVDLSQPPSTYGAASVVQLFYWCNWMHDSLYRLGFTEEAGNFQMDNFGRGGESGDPVQAEAQDGGYRNTGAMTTREDGEPGRLELSLFDGPEPDRDSALDAEVILHELTHGLTMRRVGGGLSLFNRQSAGLGEGWSDFYALALLSQEADDLHGTYPFAAYASRLLNGVGENYYFGIRRYPYTTDMTKNPLTFKDIDPTQADPHEGIPRSSGAYGGPNQIHRQGEVWASALWEARVNLIEKLGFSSGNDRILKLVTDGLNLTPPDPDFLEARQAILLADLVNFGGANHAELWAGFAKRGMGLSAVAPESWTTEGVQEAYDLPDPLTLLPQGPLVFAGPVEGPFRPSQYSLQLFNLSNSDLPWRATQDAPWLTVFPDSGTIPPGTSATNLIVSLRPEACYLGPGVFTNTIRFTNLTSGFWQEQPFLLRVGQPDYFTELFKNVPIDLAFSSLTWVPDGSPGYYRVCREPATRFPVDPTDGISLQLQDDGFVPVTLPENTPISFYGVTTNRFFVGSNGYLTFEDGDNTVTPNLETHFIQPRISALFTDLDPTSRGQISWKSLPDRIAVTYEDLPRYSASDSNNFQIELFFDGTLRITWLTLGVSTALTGLSPGGGLPDTFQESDLSAYESCTHTLFLSTPLTAAEGDGTQTNAGHVLLVPPPETNLTVTLLLSDPSQLAVPFIHPVAAGQSNVWFDITPLDDDRLDGSQRVHLTASAPGYAPGHSVLTVDDNEVGLLTLSLPSLLQEGEVDPAATLQVQPPVALPVRVLLTSSDPSELSVPAELIMPTGSNLLSFPLSAVDDREIDGPQPVQVTAHVPNWVEGTSNLTVRDNETTELTLRVPSSVNEASGLLLGAATIQLTGTLPTNLTVSVTSSHPSLLTLTNTVTVNAGQTNQTFDIGLIDNATLAGHQTVLLTASAPGWSNAVAAIEVFDDELPPVPSNPTPPDLSSNISVNTLLSWIQVEPDSPALRSTEFDVYFGTTPAWEPEHWLGSTTNLSWELPVLAPLTTYYWQIVARRLGETNSPVWQFTTKGADHFAWNGPAPRQRVGTPFDISLTARDEFATIVSNYTGTVRLQAQAPSGPGGSQILISELNPGTPDSVEFVNVSSQEVDLSHWRIWIYDSEQWPGPRLSFTIPTGTKAAPGAAFRLSEEGFFPGAFPDFFAGTNVAWVHSLAGSPLAVLLQNPAGDLADFVCGADAFPDEISYPIPVPQAQWQGMPLPGLDDALLSYHRSGNRDQNSSLDWIFAPATPSLVNSNLTLPFADSLRPISMTPTNASLFVGGQWSGQITVLEPADHVVLLAEDEAGHAGWSPPFQALLSNDLALTLTASPNPVVVGSNLLYQIGIYQAGPDQATALRLTNTLPNAVSLLSVTASQGTCTNQGNQVFCNLGNLPARSNLFVSVLVTVNGTGNLTNQALVAQTNPDPNSGNNRAVSIVAAVPVPTLQALDALALEGTQGTNLLQFNLQLSTPVAHDIVVDYLTADGTAQAGLDYLPSQGRVVFPPGSVRETVSIFLLGDSLPEGNETILLVLTNAVNALLLRPAAVGTILNDDAAPTLSLDDAAVAEGDALVTNALFRALLSYPSGLPVTVRYATFDVSAQAGLDYESRFGLLQFSPGTTNMTISVPVLGDRLDESNETFFVVLNSPTNASLLRTPGVGTIVDDDPLPAFSIMDTSLAEGDSGVTNAKLLVTLSPASGRAVTVQFATSNETATAGLDYAESSGTLLFLPGTTNQFVEIPVWGDEEMEPDETFRVHLFNPVFAELASPSGRGTIQNDDDLSGTADHFVWDSITGPKQIGQAFPVKITSVDPYQEVADKFNSSVRLHAFAGGGVQSTLLGSSQTAQATNTGSVTVGYAFTPSTNLLLTHVRHYFGSKVSVWSDDGALLASTFVDGKIGTWEETALVPPLLLPAHHRYRVGVYCSGTAYCWRTDGPSLFSHGSIDHSLRWEGDQFPISADEARWYMVDLRYQVGATQELPLLPASTGNFTNGLWTGFVHVGAPAEDVILWAQDAQGHTGASDPFEVEAVNDLTLTWSVSPSPVLAGRVLTFHATVGNTGPDPATNILLRVMLPPAVSLLTGISSQGSIYASNQVVYAALGDLAAAATAIVRAEIIPEMPGSNLVVLASVEQQGAETYTNNNALTLVTPVLFPVTILTQPQNTDAAEGTPTAMSVSALGDAPLFYQWWRQTLPIPDATNRHLTWSSAQIEDTGFYHVVVSDGRFNATSRVARLTVHSAVNAPTAGFANVTVLPGYQLLANILPKEDNRIDQILPAVPPGSTVFKANGTGFVANNFLNGWSDPAMPLPPGEGFFFKNPESNDWLLTFNGKILSGFSTNHLPVGLSLAASIPPQQGPLASQLEFPADTSDTVFVYDNTLNTFRAFRFLGDQWQPQEPSLLYGQGFFLRKERSAAWIQFFQFAVYTNTWECGPNPLGNTEGQVNFFTYHPNRAFGQVYDLDGTTPVQGEYAGQLYGGSYPDERTFQSLGTATPFLSGNVAGYLRGNLVPIPASVNAQIVFVQLRVWHTPSGTDYATALANGGPTGKSTVMALRAGASLSGNLPGLPPPDANTFPSFALQLPWTNSPPNLASISNQVVHALTLLSLASTAWDTDTPLEMLQFSLPQAPPGATINPTNGVFTWTPSDQDASTTNWATVRVTDDGDPALSAEQSFQIIVLERPFLQEVFISNGVMRLSWSAVPDQVYQVQYKNDLGDPLWLNLPELIVSTNFSASFWDTPGSASQRFYRIQLRTLLSSPQF